MKSNSAPTCYQNKKFQLKTSLASILISGCSNDLKNVEEEVDDVEVEVKCSEDVLLGVQSILSKMQNCINSFTALVHTKVFLAANVVYLVIATHHHLGVKDNVKAEDDCPDYCKDQSYISILQEKKR